jgi:hypothetical protein
MQFIVLVYNDPNLLGSLPEGEFDTMMRGCFAHVDELQRDGHRVESRMLAEPETARTVRFRNGRTTVLDGPYAEAKEVLGGFNLIEARDMDEAVEIASHFPWARTGCLEVRAVMDLGAVRERVGAPSAPDAVGAGAAA